MTTDFHCHLLPSLDDGPTSVEESLEMAAALQKFGFTTIYCTPHLIKGVYGADNDEVLSAVNALQKRLNAEHIDLVLLPGREYHLDEFLFDYLKDPLPLGETRLIMIEIPNQIPVQFVKETCYQIKRSGFIPLLAHPERCALFAIPKKEQHISFSQLLTGNPKSNTPLNTLILYLLEIGCAFQANLGSFTSYYGQQVRQTAAWLKENEVYTHFGTDLHTPEALAHFSPLTFDKMVKSPRIPPP